MRLTLEVNPKFSGDQGIRVGRESGGQQFSTAITPAIGEDDYWLAKVMVNKTQAVICFPKFGTIGIGFLKEVDWNTNLPYTSPAKKIYHHIECNRGRALPDACLKAVEMLKRYAQKVMAEREKDERHTGQSHR